MLAATIAAVSAPAVSQQSGTLKKIAEKKTITLGVRDGADPFSYLDAKQQYIGYSVDLCTKIVDAVKNAVELPDLAVTYDESDAADAHADADVRRHRYGMRRRSTNSSSARNQSPSR